MKIARVVWRMGRVRRQIKRDPKARDYRDLALTPVSDGELDGLEIFNVTTSARAAADKAKRHARAGYARAGRSMRPAGSGPGGWLRFVRRDGGRRRHAFSTKDGWPNARA